MTQDYATSLIGQQLGDYRIEGVLGRGGMGAVLRGRDTKLDRDVALKVIGQEFGGQAGEAYQSARDRFLREAKTLAGLAHPNLIHLYAVGEISGKHYFAMELVRGPTLGQWIEKFGPLRSDAAVRFTAQMLSALSTVHATGYVHRDIKPGNIMLDCTARLGGRKDNHIPILEQLTGDEAQTGRWVLMDFGLAKLTLQGPESGLTQQGLILGTPDTMSPEQAQGLETNAVSDLYSFGVVLYLTLTGKLPFQAPSAMGVMQKHLFEPAPGLEKHWPEAPVVWREAIARSLQKNPADRFQAEWEIAAALVGKVEEIPELRELARPPKIAAAALAAGTTTGGAAIPEGSTALLNSQPAVSRQAVSARTVSPTDVTIRDAQPANASANAGAAGPKKSAKPPPIPKTAQPANSATETSPSALVNLGAGAAAKPATRKVSAVGGAKKNDGTKKSDPAKRTTAGSNSAGTKKAAAASAEPPPPRRRLWLLIAAGLFLVGIALGVLLWINTTTPLPSSPQPVLEPIPGNAFWADDPAHPGQKLPLHWLGLDPATQLYFIETFNATKSVWEEQQCTHEQMMKYGDLKKPLGEDKTFPRGTALPPAAETH